MFIYYLLFIIKKSNNNNTTMMKYTTNNYLLKLIIFYLKIYYFLHCLIVAFLDNKLYSFSCTTSQVNLGCQSGLDSLLV